MPRPCISLACSSGARKGERSGSGRTRRDAERDSVTAPGRRTDAADRRTDRQARAPSDGDGNATRRDATYRAHVLGARSVPERADAGAKRSASHRPANHSSTVSFSLSFCPDNLSPPIFCLAVRDLHLPPPSSSSCPPVTSVPSSFSPSNYRRHCARYGNTCARRDTFSDG